MPSSTDWCALCQLPQVDVCQVPLVGVNVSSTQVPLVGVLCQLPQVDVCQVPPIGVLCVNFHMLMCAMFHWLVCMCQVPLVGVLCVNFHRLMCAKFHWLVCCVLSSTG